MIEIALGSKDIQIEDIIETDTMFSQERSIVKHTIVYIIMIKFVLNQKIYSNRTNTFLNLAQS